MQLQRSRPALQTFIRDDRGATSIEYALIAVIVSIAIIGGSIKIRSSLISSFSAVASGLSQSSR